MSVLALLEGLLAASIQTTLMALLGLGLLRAYRRIGLIPFLFLFSMLAAAVPATVHAAELDMGSLGSLSHVQATFVPLLIAFILVIHLTRGWRNAQLAAITFLFSGVLISAIVAGGARSAVFANASMLPANPLVPFATGLALWVGAMVATASLLGLTKLWPRSSPMLALPLTGFIGLAAHGGLVVVYGSLGLLLPGAQGMGPFTGPAIAGASAFIVCGFYATVQLSGLWPETREALVSRAPLGSDSPLERAKQRQERVQAAREQGRKEAQTYRDLIEADDQGAYVCDQRGRITYANKALAQLLEQADGNLVGDNVAHLFGSTDDRGRPRFAKWAVKPGRHKASVQLPDGHERVVEVRVRPAGKGRLYGRVMDRTEQMLRAQVEAQKERAEFYVDLLRHDIGNYVTTPLNYLSLLARRDDLDEDALRWIEASHSSVRDIADLLRRVDVLSGVDRISPEPTDAGQLVRSTGERFAEKHMELEVRYDLPDEEVFVQGSPLLEDVFVNLVNNAVRHAGASASILLGAERDGTDWVLRVDDDGPGVPDEAKTHIFDRFAHNEGAGGKGLGLYIVKTIVAALDGSAEVRDRVPGDPSKGASFRVRLPAAEAEPDAIGTRGLSDADEPATA